MYKTNTGHVKLQCSYSVVTHAGVKPNLQTIINTMRRVGVSKDKVRTRILFRVLLLFVFIVWSKPLIWFSSKCYRTTL